MAGRRTQAIEAVALEFARADGWSDAAWEVVRSGSPRAPSALRILTGATEAVKRLEADGLLSFSPPTDADALAERLQSRLFPALVDTLRALLKESRPAPSVSTQPNLKQETLSATWTARGMGVHVPEAVIQNVLPWLASVDWDTGVAPTPAPKALRALVIALHGPPTIGEHVPFAPGSGLKQETLSEAADATCAEPGCKEPRGMAARHNPEWKCLRHRYVTVTPSTERPLGLEMLANATRDRARRELDDIGRCGNIERQKSEIRGLVDALYDLAMAPRPVSAPPPFPENAERIAKLEAVANAARDTHLGVANAQQRLEDALTDLDGTR